jgi:hypothetical protein
MKKKKNQEVYTIQIAGGIWKKVYNKNIPINMGPPPRPIKPIKSN